ncbi:unnamed protein product [Rangifer tarandus platyrhynchus]|uniref:Uncharacterized protein n=1 Tax=Rangifer tarandus platyrhynchus TaxID=3082113 RepID=A0AC59ZYD2_RANTA
MCYLGAHSAGGSGGVFSKAARPSYPVSGSCDCGHINTRAGALGAGLPPSSPRSSEQRRRLLPRIRFLAPSVAAEDTDGFAQVASELGVLINENKAPRVAPQQVPKAGPFGCYLPGR